MRKFSLFLVAVLFFCFGVVTPGCGKNASGEAPEVAAGTWINTDNFKLSDHKDKIVIVEFWATWCPPCRTSIPHLKTLYNEYKDKGVVLVSLSQEPADTINEFNKKAGMNWVIGAESTSGSAYGVTGIPTAFIVVDNKIVWNGHPMGGLDEKIKELVAARGDSAAAPATAKEPAKEEAIIPAGDPDAPVAAPVEEKSEGDEPASEEVSEEAPEETPEEASEEDSLDTEDEILPAADDEDVSEEGDKSLGE